MFSISREPFWSKLWDQWVWITRSTVSASLAAGRCIFIWTLCKGNQLTGDVVIESWSSGVCKVESLKVKFHRQLKRILAVEIIVPIHMMTSSNGNIFRVTGPLCGEFTDPGEFPTQRPVTRSFDVFFDLRLNKRLSKQPWGWWFETPSWSLWRQCNEKLECSAI